MTASESWRAWIIEATAVLCASCAVTYVLFDPVFADWFGQVIVGPGFLRADTYLMLWILSWGSYALTAQPLDFFQANILHPAPSTLAGAEHMAGYLPLFAPPYYLTDNPAFAFQVTLFLSFALSGAGMYALLRHWGCSRWGAAFGGLLMIAAPGKFNRAFVVQSIGWLYLPLALVFLERVIDRGKLRDAAGLVVLLALQMLCSFYLAYISLAILGAYCLVVLGWRGLIRRRYRLRNLIVAAAGMALAGGVLVLFALPYVERAASGEIPDQADAGLKTFSMVRSWDAYGRSPRHGPIWGASYYIGILPFLLGLYALLPERTAGRWCGNVVAYGLLAAVVVTGILAAGPLATFEDVQLPPLYDLFLLLPGFSSVRGANRFALGLNFAFAALAGFGMSKLARRCERFPAAVPMIWIAVVSLTYVDFGHRDFAHSVLPVATGAEIPRVYRTLAELDHGVLLELPAGCDRGFRQIVVESEYGYFSTAHWHRILNGYTGYQPDSTTDVLTIARALPDPIALKQLVRMTGLRYVLVHLDGMPADAERVWRSPPGLELLERDGQDLLFQVTDASTEDLSDELLTRQSKGRTLGGLPIEAVPTDARRALIGFAEPRVEKFFGGLLKTLGVTAWNQSDRTWPGIASGDDRVVHWAVRWTHVASGLVREDLTVAPLPYDLAPGHEVRTTITVRPPKKVADFQLEVGLSQDGEWFPNPAKKDSIPVVSLHAIRKLQGR